MAEEGNKVTYFLAGLGIGTLIGVLFAPHSGEETRRIVRGKADEGRDYLVRKSREAREQAEEIVSKGKETAEELISKGKEAVTRQKDNIQAAVEAGKQAYREAGREMEGKPGRRESSSAAADWRKEPTGSEG